MLLADAIVFHRRRTTLKKFFRQVFNWGVARINLGKIDSSMLEIIHFAPSFFTFLSLLSIVGLIIYQGIFIPVTIFGLLALFFISLIGGVKTRSIIVMLLLIIVIPAQIFGYGLGFLIAFFKRFILNQDEFTGFQKKYY